MDDVTLRAPGASVGVRGCLLMLLGWFLLASVWAFSNPVSASPDEPAHMIRVLGIAHGDWYGKPANPNYRKVYPSTIGSRKTYELLLEAGRLVRVPAKLAPPTLVPCFAHDPRRTPNCNETSATPALGPGTYYSYVGTYPPLPYAISAIGARLASSYSAADHLARAVNVLACTALLGLALLARRRTVFSAAMFSLAVTPTVLFLAASVNPSGLEAASAVAVWSCLSALAAPDARRRCATAGLIVGGAVLLNVRPASWLWFAAIVAAVSLFSGRSLLKQARTRNGLITAGLLAVAWLLALLWEFRIMAHPSRGPLHVDLTPSVRPLIDQTVGKFGWLDVQLPAAAIDAWCVAVVAGVIAALLVMPVRQRLVLLLLMLSLPWLASVYDAYLRASGGMGLQGRYMLPLTVGVPVLAGSVATWKGRNAAVAARIAGVSTITIAVVQVVAIVVNARRYDGGVTWPLIFPFAHASWNPHLGWACAVLLAISAAAAWLAGVHFRSIRQSPERQPVSDHA